MKPGPLIYLKPRLGHGAARKGAGVSPHALFVIERTSPGSRVSLFSELGGEGVFRKVDGGCRPSDPPAWYGDSLIRSKWHDTGVGDAVGEQITNVYN